ncbi:MAG: anaerobic ribonucleoside-triphosphate reductase [Candidatus Bathyarchaeia archaeon]
MSSQRQHQRLRGIRVLKAVSSTVRLNILSALFDHGPLSYTELMSFLKMNPSRDAGRFAYHLKFLLKADLIEADVESKKYRLTDLGKMVIDVAEEIEKRSLKVQRILVRTSRFTLEEFDATKIANSLIKEAGVSPELAQKIAKEAEKRLLKARTRYLTAPLIREVVNGILIERGLEEHRHKLTRLGLPVYDVSAYLMRSKAAADASSVCEDFGRSVLEEYTLLSVLPRDIADAYLSGEIHLHGLGYWILKPSEVIHDLRFFMKNGINLNPTNFSKPSVKPPKSFEAALTLTLNILLQASKETDGAQVLEYFNIFLAPFLKGLEKAVVKEALRLFIISVSHHVDASINLELTMPEFLSDKPAIGPASGCYGDYVSGSQLLASLVLEVFDEESHEKPLLNPRLIVKIRPETFKDSTAADILLRAHHLASEKGIPCFANLSGKNEQYAVFSPSGSVLRADFKEDWELDTLRTGVLGIVTVNLPRIVLECGKDERKLFTLLREKLEMATRALEIKGRTLKQRGRNFLSFLTQSANGDQYFRDESAARLVNLVGLKEASEALSGKSIYEDEKVQRFASEIIKNIAEFLPKSGRSERRLLPSALPCADASERLAKQDIERFGVAKVRFQGSREKPHYSSCSRINLQNWEVQSKILAVEKGLYEPLVGGNLTVVELGNGEYTPDTLLSFTKKFVEDYKLGFFTYNRDLTYCSQCRKSWFGKLQKCPICGSVGTLAAFTRYQ